MNNYFIGVMTGTSADGLDGCIVSFGSEFKLITATSLSLGDSYKKDYEECIDEGLKEVDESKKLSQLEDILNKKTDDLVAALLKKAQLNSEEISAIGFSGQTVFHTNNKSYQIGNPQSIANNSEIGVLSDFRNFDISHGGMGAPLIPEFHKYLYSEENKRKIIFNIGGIANGTYLMNKNISLASDVGPGNCLMDYIASKKLTATFDKEGYSAGTGKFLKPLYEKLIKNCSSMKYPRADDKNDYYNLINSSILKIPPNDSLNTLANFTAQKIKDFFIFCEKPEEIIFHGGGTNNLFLMSLIEERLGQNIKTTDDVIPSKFVEAAAFAYLAYLERGKVYIAKQ